MTVNTPLTLLLLLLLLPAGCSPVEEQGDNRSDAAENVHAADVARLNRRIDGLEADLQRAQDEMAEESRKAESETDALRRELSELRTALDARKSIQPESKAGQETGQGTLSGRIRITGHPPELPPLIRQGSTKVKDATVCAAEDIPDERLLIGPDNGIANVFVYLAAAPTGDRQDEASDGPVIVDQFRCRFLPHTLIVRTGQPVRLLNADPVAASFHSFPRHNRAVNYALPPGDRDGRLFSYSHPETEPIAVRSDFHTWMLAWHLPVSHPFAAVTARDGTFEIHNLPAGQHRFLVWHELAGFLSQELTVEISHQQTTETELKYPADQFQP